MPPIGLLPQQCIGTARLISVPDLSTKMPTHSLIEHLQWQSYWPVIEEINLKFSQLGRHCHLLNFYLCEKGVPTGIDRVCLWQSHVFFSNNSHLSRMRSTCLQQTPWMTRTSNWTRTLGSWGDAKRMSNQSLTWLQSSYNLVCSLGAEKAS